MSVKPQQTVHLAFERQLITLAIDDLVPLKTMRHNFKASKKYQQIVSSIESIGIVEPPAVIADPKSANKYLLLDGHLRIEALRELDISEVRCLIATDDETYTYNKRLNRLSATQEHAMVVKALDRGVSAERIAQALGLGAGSIRRRSRLLDGICPEVVELLKDKPCPMKVFEILRPMKPLRQIAAAEIMTGQGNYTAAFARTILLATPPDQLVAQRRKDQTKDGALEQMARLERELVALQSQVKAVEDSYGVDNLHLTLAQAYLKKLLANGRVVRWLSQHRPEYLEQFQTIAEVSALPS